MEMQQTNRGFFIAKFKDSYGHECSLQKSSNVNDNIWLGIDNPKLVVFENVTKGKYLETNMPENFSVSCRMHLNQEQVKQLLPYLIKFVETGELE